MFLLGPFLKRQNFFWNNRLKKYNLTDLGLNNTFLKVLKKINIAKALATYNHIINQCFSTNHTIHCTILKQLTVSTNFTFREINYPQASRVAANHLYDVNIFKPLFYSSVNSTVFLIIYFDASDKFKHLIFDFSWTMWKSNRKCFLATVAWRIWNLKLIDKLFFERIL